MQCAVKDDTNHEDPNFTMDNLHVKLTEEKSIQVPDQPKIASFQVKNQIELTTFCKDELIHEEISANANHPSHSTQHHCIPLFRSICI